MAAPAAAAAAAAAPAPPGLPIAPTKELVAAIATVPDGLVQVPMSVLVSLAKTVQFRLEQSFDIHPAKRALWDAIADPAHPVYIIPLRHKYNNGASVNAFPTWLRIHPGVGRAFVYDGVYDMFARHVMMYQLYAPSALVEAAVKADVTRVYSDFVVLSADTWPYYRKLLCRTPRLDADGTPYPHRNWILLTKSYTGEYVRDNILKPATVDGWYTGRCLASVMIELGYEFYVSAAEYYKVVTKRDPRKMLSLASLAKRAVVRLHGDRGVRPEDMYTGDHTLLPPAHKPPQRVFNKKLWFNTPLSAKFNTDLDRTNGVAGHFI